MTSNRDQKLVIVESPTKAKTIRKFLGDGYRVEASMGHVRDLPASAAEVPAEVKDKSWARLGVDVENGFQPIYVIPHGKKKIVTELKRALKNASEVYLATDEDREGEAIGWHLVELLDPKVPVRRMVFHEITKDAIQQAISTPRELNGDLVQAQETRRVLDRLVGYTVSPLLWKKVAPRLSAGRVQSAAVRLLVLRERERMAFHSAVYWDLKAALEKDATTFDAQLAAVDGRRLASGKDFDEKTGKLAAGADVLVLDEGAAKALVDEARQADFTVESLEKRQATRSPYPPFTTSTLQQEANRKLGMSAKRTMQTAQRLYESGHITYMRTDSVNLSEEALSGIGKMITERYGPDYTTGPRRYKTKSKGAQEAHEAIRPAGTHMATADELGLSGEQAKLYELIWKRTVASQMADAKLAFTTAKIIAKTASGKALELRATGREVLFPGFFRAYVESSDDAAAVSDDRSQPLPNLSEGDVLPCKDIEALRHETKPPARYTEASLVKALEAAGIGRPSTYATIIDTIQQRGYVLNKNKQLVPTFTSMAVTKLLEETLEPIVDLRFTAEMEERLDEIAEGRDAKSFLQDFYNGQLLGMVEAAMDVDARQVCTISKWGDGELRVGRYGPFLDMSSDGENQRVSLPADVAPSEVDSAFIDRLIELAKKGGEPLGIDPESGEPVFALVGPYGPYVQLGEASKEKGAPKPKRVSVPKDIDPTTVDFQMALKLLSLPRTLGEHPETGKPVQAGLGRFGPYVVHDKIYASLKAEDDVLEVELPRALQLLADKKPRRRGSEALKELGEHPDGGAVRIMQGPYGPYVKWEKVNAGLPEGMTPEEVTLEEAVAWVNAKAEQKGGRRKKAATKSAAKPKKKTAKADGAKKSAAKKTAKKTPAKKSAAKKASAGNGKKAGSKDASKQKDDGGEDGATLSTHGGAEA